MVWVCRRAVAPAVSLGPIPGQPRPGFAKLDRALALGEALRDRPQDSIGVVSTPHGAQELRVADRRPQLERARALLVRDAKRPLVALRGRGAGSGRGQLAAEPREFRVPAARLAPLR